MRGTAAAPALLVVALMLGTGGCGDGSTSALAKGEPTTSQGPNSGAPTNEEPTSDASADGESGLGLAFAENSGRWDLVLADVRVASHEDFDRIVIEFTGTGTPGWSVQYVDEPTLDGSGTVIELGGDAFLDIYASGTVYQESDDYDGPQRFEPENGGAVAEVYLVGAFEGATQVLAGIDGDRVPFRVFALTSPSRLVIDVGDDSKGQAVAAADKSRERPLVFGPRGVGPLRLGMTHHQIVNTKAARAQLGSRHDGWPAGCRVLQYRPGRFGHTPGHTLIGALSPRHGVERIYATRRMVTPEGIHLGSTVAEVREAYDRPHAHTGDLVIVPASPETVYRIQLSGVVVSMSLEMRHLDCTI